MDIWKGQRDGSAVIRCRIRRDRNCSQNEGSSDRGVGAYWRDSHGGWNQ